MKQPPALRTGEPSYFVVASTPESARPTRRTFANIFAAACLAGIVVRLTLARILKTSAKMCRLQTAGRRGTLGFNGPSPSGLPRCPCGSGRGLPDGGAVFHAPSAWIRRSVHAGGGQPRGDRAWHARRHGAGSCATLRHLPLVALERPIRRLELPLAAVRQRIHRSRRKSADPRPSTRRHRESPGSRTSGRLTTVLIQTLVSCGHRSHEAMLTAFVIQP